MKDLSGRHEDDATSRDCARGRGVRIDLGSMVRRRMLQTCKPEDNALDTRLVDGGASDTKENHDHIRN